MILEFDVLANVVVVVVVVVVLIAARKFCTFDSQRVSRK